MSNRPDIALARQQQAIWHAAQQGDPEALFAVAFWHLAGDVVPRDLARARQILRKAVEAGHAEAAAIEIALAANGTGAPADWDLAAKRLEQASETFGGEFKRQRDLLASALSFDADGCDVQTFSSRPSIRLFRQALTPQECAHIIEASRQYLEPAMVQDPVSGRLIPHPIRTSSAAVVGPTRATLPLYAVCRRVFGMIDIAFEQAESMTVLHYKPGQQFKAHLDTLPHTRNQRCATALIYLNAQYSGGETVFPKLNISVRGGQGDLLVFDNTQGDGLPDPLSLHSGDPVETGEKWLGSIWIRQRPFDMWKGPDQA